MGKPLDDPNRITPAEAAYILRMDRESVCECMKQNKFPVKDDKESELEIVNNLRKKCIESEKSICV